MKQLVHSEVLNHDVKTEIIVIAENIRTPENVGMLFRVSEAFGVKKVFLIGDSPNLENKKVLRTARSTEKQLSVQFFETSLNVISQLKKENYKLIGLEHTDKSESLHIANFSNIKKIALFIGAERFGIEQDTLSQLDMVVHINLFGKNSSINVVNALTATLYEITK